MPWNPDQYHKFQAARSAPFDDLTALVNRRENLTTVDLPDTFMNTYRERLRQHMPASPVFYTFRRAFFIATRTV